MKVFISQPMRDKTDKEISAERSIIMGALLNKYGQGREIEIINSFFNDDHPFKLLFNLENPLTSLGLSLMLMANADVVVFAKNWDRYRGCRIEHECAVQYGFDILEM